MVYQEKFVVAVKVDGKVLRESGSTVQLPFGSEYSVLLKNLSAVRSLVNVQIDGQDVAGELVVPANGDLELERFIRNGNLSSGNRFKFIERTEDIENHRGLKAEDGLIRVEYKFEKKPVIKDEVIHRYHYYDHYPWYHYDWPYRYPQWYQTWSQNANAIFSGNTSTSDLSSVPIYKSSIARSAGNMQVMAMSNTSLTSASNDAGITVPGSESFQQFQTVSSFPTEQGHVIVLKLVGQVGTKKVKKAVDVKKKLSCASCGKASKSTEKFCGKCGTALQVI